ncbi:MAG: hypothetical protein KAI38_07880, partial [Candidatus Latescibacteria bacterium]|nr:hypothetical protein [Candidatus Latescibacterota bacterium]
TVMQTSAGEQLDDKTDDETITIDASSAAYLIVDTQNSESETAGTAFDITVTARTSEHATATDYVGTKSLTWTTNATASPDGTNRSIPSDGNRMFTAGVLTITDGGTLYDSGEGTRYIRVSDDGGLNSNNSYSGGQTITVNDGIHAETRIKTADETADGDYDNNISGADTLQGATQASPYASVNLYGVSYDAYGNLITDVSGTWGLTDNLSSAGPLSSGTGIDNVYTANTETGSVNTGTITLNNGYPDATGTITVDDDDGATVTGFGVTTDGADQHYVYASWANGSSGDDGATGDPTDYDIVWTVEGNGQIDNNTKWNAATSVGTSEKFSFSTGSWHIDMTPFPAGNKYFAIRTTDDVGNISVLASGAYTTTSDYSLPVELSSFTAFPDYGQIVLKWRTESEVNNLGFDLYRAISEEGPFEKITERRIEGAGTSASAVDYEYVDEKIEEGMTYFYKIESMDYDGTKYMKDIVVRVQELRVPKKFALSQNFPNPFNPRTIIRYTLPYATAVRLVIYNSSGQLVRTLVDGAQSMGVHSVSWNGETDSGVRAASG